MITTTASHSVKHTTTPKTSLFETNQTGGNSGKMGRFNVNECVCSLTGVTEAAVLTAEMKTSNTAAIKFSDVAPKTDPLYFTFRYLLLLTVSISALLIIIFAATQRAEKVLCRSASRCVCVSAKPLISRIDCMPH